MFLKECIFLKKITHKLNLKHIYIFIVHCEVGSLWKIVYLIILLRYVVSQVQNFVKHSWPWLTQIVLSLNLFRICLCILLVNKTCLVTADLKFIYLPTSDNILNTLDLCGYTQSTHIVYDTMLITDWFQFLQIMLHRRIKSCIHLIFNS